MLCESCLAFYRDDSFVEMTNEEWVEVAMAMGNMVADHECERITDGAQCVCIGHSS